MKINHAAIIVAVITLFAACAEDPFRVNAEFASWQNLPLDTPVYFENQVIGRVVESQTDDKRIVTLELNKEVAGALGDNVAVVVNANKPGSPLELFDRGGAEQGALQNGQVIKGMGSSFELSAWLLGDALLQGSDTVAKTLETFQEYLQSDEFEQDQVAIKQQIEAAKESAQEVFKQLERDLNQAAGELTDSEQSASEAATEALKELTDELAPVLDELATSGSELATQLEDFTRGLEQGYPDQQGSGHTASLELIDRVIEALEELKLQVEKDQQDGSDSGENRSEDQK